MALLGASPSAGVAPSSAWEEEGEAHASPAWLFSRGRLGRLSEESALVAPLTLEGPRLGAAAEMPKAREAPSSQAVITLPSSPPAPPAPVSSDPSAVLDQAAN